MITPLRIAIIVAILLWLASIIIAKNNNKKNYWFYIITIIVFWFVGVAILIELAMLVSGYLFDFDTSEIASISTVLFVLLILYGLLGFRFRK